MQQLSGPVLFCTSSEAQHRRHSQVGVGRGTVGFTHLCTLWGWLGASTSPGKNCSSSRGCSELCQPPKSCLMTVSQPRVFTATCVRQMLPTCPLFSWFCSYQEPSAETCKKVKLGQFHQHKTAPALGEFSSGHLWFLFSPCAPPGQHTMARMLGREGESAVQIRVELPLNVSGKSPCERKAEILKVDQRGEFAPSRNILLAAICFLPCVPAQSMSAGLRAHLEMFAN